MVDEFPGCAHVSQPRPPSLVMAPPTGTSVAVLPVAGPPGPVGPAGVAGPPGVAGDSGAALAYVYTTSNPAMVHQIQHGLAFKPGGITCLDADGASLLGWSVTHPVLGITEVTFGAAVTPTVYLS